MALPLAGIGAGVEIFKGIGSVVGNLFSGPDENQERQKIAVQYQTEFANQTTVEKRLAYYTERENLYTPSFRQSATKVPLRYYDAWQAVKGTFAAQIEQDQRAALRTQGFTSPSLTVQPSLQTLQPIGSNIVPQIIQQPTNNIMQKKSSKLWIWVAAGVAVLVAAVLYLKKKRK